MSHQCCPTISVAGKLHAHGARAHPCAAPRQPHRPHRIFQPAAAGARNAAPGQRNLRMTATQRALHHLAHRRLTHRTVPIDRLGPHAQHLVLRGIAVGDEAAFEPLRAPSDRSHRLRNPAARAGFRWRERPNPLSEHLAESFRQNLLFHLASSCRHPPQRVSSSPFCAKLPGLALLAGPIGHAVKQIMNDAPTPARGRPLSVLDQHLAPHGLLTRLMYRATRIRALWFKRWQINWFIRRYGVDMSIAEHPDLEAYPDFNTFFIRALRTGARPLPTDPAAIISPVDGAVSQAD